MSHNQKVADIRAKLERWKSHNEVHAKPADGVLYDMLKDLLDLFQIPGYEDEQEQVQELSNDEGGEIGEVVDELQVSSNDEGGEGGNSPDEPPILP